MAVAAAVVVATALDSEVQVSEGRLRSGVDLLGNRFWVP